MTDAPIDITGRRRLLMDPRVVAEMRNAIPSVAEANKIGKVIDVPAGLRGRASVGNASVVWDPAVGKVRVYHELQFSHTYRVIALAESEDGEHFTRPVLGARALDGDRHNSLIALHVDTPRTRRMVRAGLATSPVNMQGPIDGPDWRDADRIEQFVDTPTGTPAERGTCVRVLHDDRAVYVAVDCPGGGPWSPDDAPSSMLATDHVEIFIDPRLDRTHYHQFVVSVHGRTVEYQGGPGGGVQQPTAWEVDVRHRADGWSVLARIPFASLGLPPDDPGCAWGINVGHTACAGPNPGIENWTARGTHLKPHAFGVLVFSEHEFATRHQPLWEDVCTAQSPTPTPCGTCVLIDPNGPDSQRYKMTWREAGSMFVSTSPDGVTFTTQTRIIDSGNLDTMNQMLWDPGLRQYVVYTRWWFREETYPGRRRAVARMASDCWDGPWPERQVVMDPADLPGHDPYHDFYTPGVFLYEDLYVALVTVFHRDVGLGTLEPTLAQSTDGVHWRFVGGGRPIIRRSDHGWDSGMLLFCAAPVRLDDRVYLYYRATAAQHFEDVDTIYADPGGIGAAWVRRDGFMGYLGRNDFPGQVTTPALVFHEGEDLVVNVETVGARGQLRVEVVGDDRFSAHACVPVRGDHVSCPVRWRDACLPELRGKPFRLRFLLDGAKLYAFEVT